MKKKLAHILFLILTTSSLFAFRPIGHVLLKDKIVKGLSHDNRFKKAMLAYPQIAAWGSVGPDLAYNIDFSRTGKKGWKRQMKNSWQVADMAHYNSVGTFLTNLVEEAYASNDDKFIAFVGGWITHVAGDFGSHGIYVKPEAGYYIANEKGQDHHGHLEKMADAYFYASYAKQFYPECDSFTPTIYWKSFFGVKPNFDTVQVAELEKMLGGKVKELFNKVYEQTYEIKGANINLVALASTYYRGVGLGLSKLTGEKFRQYTIPEAMDSIKRFNRKNLIDSAFIFAQQKGVEYLTTANDKKYVFSNTWNLDVGENGAPTFIVRMDVAEKKTARTKNNVHLIAIHKDGSVFDEKQLTTKFMYLKFAFYQKDTYFYAVYLGGDKGELADKWKIENIAEVKLILKKRIFNPYPNWMRLKKTELLYQGKVVSAKKSESNSKKSFFIFRKRRPIVFKLS